MRSNTFRIDARRRARHAMHVQPGELQGLQQVAPGSSTMTASPGRSSVRTIRCARRQQHVRCGVDRQAVTVELLGNALAQRRKTIRMPIVRNPRRRHAPDRAQRMLKAAFVDPFSLGSQPQPDLIGTE